MNKARLTREFAALVKAKRVKRAVVFVACGPVPIRCQERIRLARLQDRSVANVERVNCDGCLMRDRADGWCPPMTPELVFEKRINRVKCPTRRGTGDNEIVTDGVN